jgi:hypothetical protein
MLDNRKCGWEKSKKENDSGPKKVEELRKELVEKARKEEELRILADEEENKYYN